MLPGEGRAAPTTGREAATDPGAPSEGLGLGSGVDYLDVLRTLEPEGAQAIPVPGPAGQEALSRPCSGSCPRALKVLSAPSALAPRDPEGEPHTVRSVFPFELHPLGAVAQPPGATSPAPCTSSHQG